MLQIFPYIFWHKIFLVSQDLKAGIVLQWRFSASRRQTHTPWILNVQYSYLVSEMILNGNLHHCCVELPELAPAGWMGSGCGVGGQKDECGSKTWRRDGASLQQVRSSGLQFLKSDAIYGITCVHMNQVIISSWNLLSRLASAGQSQTLRCYIHNFRALIQRKQRLRYWEKWDQKYFSMVSIRHWDKRGV